MAKNNFQDNDIAIKVEGVSKSFKLPHEKSGSIKSALLGWRKKKRGYENQHVLKDISFEIKKGEFFGIVGRNGSGKSTLLKLISQIYTPDEGSITVNGKLTPFIELGVGFNPELSGRDNVYLNGALLGFSREEMEAMYDEIVEFAELERFMDQKLKNYSSGMQVRLAFSIAIRANTDILVLDEVLAVGDEAFQRKCEEYFASVKKKKKTIVLVTHSMESVRKFCSKAMLIRGGEIVSFGSPDDIASEYSLENLVTVSTGISKEKNSVNEQKEGPVKNLRVELLSGKRLSEDEEVRVRVSYSVMGGMPTRVFLSLQDMDRNAPLFAASSPILRKKEVNVEWNTTLNAINNTNIKVQISVRGGDNEILHFLPDSHSPVFALIRQDYEDQKTTWAVMYNRGQWSEDAGPVSRSST